MVRLFLALLVLALATTAPAAPKDDLAALFLPALVDALRKDGWEIITADEAFADPIARVAPDTPSAQGSRIEAMAWEKGLPAPRWYERENLKVANALFAQRVLKERAAP